jgi:hemoglobin-like flavoprotein
MNPHDIHLIRHSFNLVQPHAARTAQQFYENLFAADPGLRELFRTDIRHQGERLMTMLAAAIRVLDDPYTLHAALRLLGRRHVGYGVQPAHYATVGAALIKTLRDGLGDAFTVEVHDAWAAMYGIVSRTMMEAAREGASAEMVR